MDLYVPNLPNFRAEDFPFTIENSQRALAFPQTKNRQINCAVQETSLSGRGFRSIGVFQNLVSK